MDWQDFRIYLLVGTMALIVSLKESFDRGSKSLRDRYFS
jgi:hypothetical protein